MPNNWGGRRPGAGRKSGLRQNTEIIPRISVPEHARRYTHRAVRILASVMSYGYLTRYERNQDGSRKRIQDPASVALRAHCAEVLLERGHGRPHQAIAVADGSSEGSKTLRELILGAMALRDAEVPTIEHEPVSNDDDEDDDSDLGPPPEPGEIVLPVDTTKPRRNHQRAEEERRIRGGVI